MNDYVWWTCSAMCPPGVKCALSIRKTFVFKKLFLGKTLTKKQFLYMLNIENIKNLHFCWDFL